jgi:hypothetical protein
MITKYTNRLCLLIPLLWGGGLLTQRTSAASATATVTATGSNAVLNVDRLNGVFTLTGFETINGLSEAVGVITAQATDTAGLSIDILTNVPVRVPVVLSETLKAQTSLLEGLSSEPVPPPQLSTNLCTILAISIEFVDVTIPGLGLNVHVNQLLIGVRADRETRLGDVLCTLLGDDPGASNSAISLSPTLNIRLENNRVMVDARGPATLQSTTSLTESASWTNVLALGSALQTLTPTSPVQFFRLATAAAETTHASRGGFSLGNVGGVFTVSDFRPVNGTKMAAGWLTANVTDPTGTSEVGMFTNFPVRVPVSGVLEGNPIDAGSIDDPVILPQLSTNTCSLLGIVVGAIDVTIPGLGLNVHVNQISIVVRADRETTVGDLLCTLLGDDLLGAPLEGNKVAPATSTENGLTVEQLRALVGIVLGPGLAETTDAAGSQLTAKNKGLSKKNSKKTNLVLLQDLFQAVMVTMEPSTSKAKLKHKKPAKIAAP